MVANETYSTRKKNQHLPFAIQYSPFTNLQQKSDQASNPIP